MEVITYVDSLNSLVDILSLSLTSTKLYEQINRRDIYDYLEKKFTLNPFNNLSEAIQLDSEDVDQRLLKAVSDNNYFSVERLYRRASYKSLSMAFSRAIKLNYVDIINLLLNSDVSYNKDYVLTTAILVGDLELISKLIDKGARVTANHVAKAITSGNVNVLTYLLEINSKVLNDLVVRYAADRTTNDEILAALDKYY